MGILYVKEAFTLANKKHVYTEKLQALCTTRDCKKTGALSNNHGVFVGCQKNFSKKRGIRNSGATFPPSLPLSYIQTLFIPELHTLFILRPAKRADAEGGNGAGLGHSKNVFFFILYINKQNCVRNICLRFIANFYTAKRIRLKMF